MAVEFSVAGWSRCLDSYVRQAKTVALFDADGNRLTDPFELVSAKWDSVIVGRLATASYPEIQWRFSKPEAVAGYEVRAEDGTVLWSEKFPFAQDRPKKVDIQALMLTIEIDTAG